MNIHILTVPNSEIKKRKGFTGADWWWEEGDLMIKVAAELTDWREAMALAMHEAFEALLCKHMDITVEQVDAFDSEFKGENVVDVNAGDDPQAPYKIPHTFATAAERIFTGAMGIDWKSYDERLSAL